MRWIATDSGGGVPSSTMTLPVRKMGREGIWLGFVVEGVVVVGNGLVRPVLPTLPEEPGEVVVGLDGLL